MDEVCILILCTRGRLTLVLHPALGQFWLLARWNPYHALVVPVSLHKPMKMSTLLLHGLKNSEMAWWKSAQSSDQSTSCVDPRLELWARVSSGLQPRVWNISPLGQPASHTWPHSHTRHDTWLHVGTPSYVICQVYYCPFSSGYRDIFAPLDMRNLNL